MSGPKGATYVLSPAEIARQALAAAQVRLQEAQRQVAFARALLGAAEGVPAPRLRPSTDATELDRQVDVLIAHAEQLRALHHQRRLDSVAARVSEALADFELVVPELAPSTQSEPATPKPRERSATRAHIARIQRMIPALPEADQASLLERLTTVSTLAQGADAIRATQAAESLLNDVVQAERRATKQRTLERHRAALSVTFADVPQQEREAWGAVAAATNERELARARADLEAARARTQRLNHQRFVLEQTEAAFRELGYGVEVVSEEGADTVLARKPGWAHHGLRLLFPQGQEAFSSIPEAYGATHGHDDLAFETESCRDLTTVVGRLATQGVFVSTHLALQPGDQPVRRAAPVTSRTRTAAPKEKSL